jgi:imidazolonepropionase
MNLIENIAQLATCRAEGGQGEIHPIADAAMVWEGATIRWVGPRRELPAEYRGAERLDAGGGLVVPGLVDCHTHLAFGGWRADEFTQRIQGASYLDITRAGGGIARTVRVTREAGEDALYQRARGFVREMIALGVTTIECKSGYGLDREHELELLRVYRRLAETEPVGIVPTFLGAHLVPPEYRERREAYVALLVDELIPAVAAERLAACCDVFVEESAFTVEEARRILLAGRNAGLGLKLHADQLTSSGGAELAAEVGALSADHLKHASPAGIAALAAAGVER